MKTTRIKKALIALDYDPTSQKVAEMGYLLAKSMGAEVVLLHVLSEPVYYASTEFSPIMGFTGYADFEPSQLDSPGGLKKASRYFLDKTKMHLKDDTIKTMVTEGDFAGSILEAAKQINAGVIVMGSHSKKWLEDIVMGSVTKRVLHQTTMPLFIIPTRKTPAM